MVLGIIAFCIHQVQVLNNEQYTCSYCCLFLSDIPLPKPGLITNRSTSSRQPKITRNKASTNKTAALIQIPTTSIAQNLTQNYQTSTQLSSEVNGREMNYQHQPAAVYFDGNINRFTTDQKPDAPNHTTSYALNRSSQLFSLNSTQGNIADARGTTPVGTSHLSAFSALQPRRIDHDPTNSIASHRSNNEVVISNSTPHQIDGSQHANTIRDSTSNRTATYEAADMTSLAASVKSLTQTVAHLMGEVNSLRVSIDHPLPQPSSHPPAGATHISNSASPIHPDSRKSASDAYSTNYPSHLSISNFPASERPFIPLSHGEHSTPQLEGLNNEVNRLLDVSVQSRRWDKNSQAPVSTLSHSSVVVRPKAKKRKMGNTDDVQILTISYDSEHGSALETYRN